MVLGYWRFIKNYTESQEKIKQYEKYTKKWTVLVKKAELFW